MKLHFIDFSTWEEHDAENKSDCINETEKDSGICMKTSNLKNGSSEKLSPFALTNNNKVKL